MSLVSQREITYVDRERMQENIDITKNRLNTKQPSVLNTPIDVLGNEETTVEGALQAINEKEMVISWSDYQALSPEAQTNGTTYFIYDAGDEDGKELAQGYLNPNDGKFYEEPTYETEISSSVDMLYVALDTNKLYRYDSTEAEFIQIGGATQPLFIDSENYISIDYDSI